MMKKDNNVDKMSEIKEEIKELKEEVKNCQEEKVNTEKELEEYKKKADEYYDQLLRLKADFENYRKRVEKEKKELMEWARYNMMLEILPVYEMLKTAKTHFNSSDVESLKMGIDMILSEFDKFFKNVGLSEIDVLDKQYDPMTSEIVATVDGEEDGKVVEVIQPGYMFNSQVIRPAKVKVIKKKDKQISEQQGQIDSKTEEKPC